MGFNGSDGFSAPAASATSSGTALSAATWKTITTFNGWDATLDTNNLLSDDFNVGDGVLMYQITGNSRQLDGIREGALKRVDLDTFAEFLGTTGDRLRSNQDMIIAKVANANDEAWPIDTSFAFGFCDNAVQASVDGVGAGIYRTFSSDTYGLTTINPTSDAFHGTTPRTTGSYVVSYLQENSNNVSLTLLAGRTDEFTGQPLIEVQGGVKASVATPYDYFFLWVGSTLQTIGTTVYNVTASVEFTYLPTDEIFPIR